MHNGTSREDLSARLRLLGVGNAPYVEALLESYLRDRDSVSEDWRDYFAGLTPSDRGGPVGAADRFTRRSVFNPPAINGAANGAAADAQAFQHRVDQLVRAYRSRGHLAARLDPLGLAKVDASAIDPEEYHLTDADENREVVYQAYSTAEQQRVPLGELRRKLTQTYCQSIGYEFTHIRDRTRRDWLQQRIEAAEGGAEFPRETQLRILTQLSKAVTFEEFVRKKYLGAKTFSLEGAETLIPMLDLALEHAAKRGVDEVVIGMAHRGRLNVLSNIVGKRPLEIFREFEDQNPDWWRGRGDVKYHLGASGDWRSSSGGSLHVSACFNPSHLEFVDPVAQGRVRAKQDHANDQDRRRGMALLIHGDAAFAGEGVVQESLNLSGLPGYTTGGVLHVVVNNQLGFTTPPAAGRCTEYATDVARGLQAPILHVNGEFPLAVASVVELAMDFRAEFGRDVVIDMYCYRRWGHNEADEPGFTQPVMYEAIESRDSIYQRYRAHMLDLQQVTDEEADRIAAQQHAELADAFAEAQEPLAQPEHPPQGGVWAGFHGAADSNDEATTRVPRERLVGLLERLTTVPEGFHLHPKLRRAFDRRQEMARGDATIDWATAEALAMASLAVEGARVRLSGQDSGRGTFSQRHALLHDATDGHEVSIFDNLSDDQAPVEVVNSPLSEAAALGFEYGYSLDFPDALVMWEAQYGDFVNAAQVIIDQFIASAEDKWRRLSGLVLLLPHGFEGQGPEHSSARVERFLALSAEDNLQVVCPSSPAQYFHLLRRQVLRTSRAPLIVLTPKSLLRHPRMTSPLEELSNGGFRRVIRDEMADPGAVTKVLLSSGKMAFDLLDARDQEERTDVAIHRVDQFYPLDERLLADMLERCPHGTPVVWVQEEPANMGAWPYWKNRFGDRVAQHYPFSGVTREASASPATGSKAAHLAEQQELIQRAFNDASNP